MKLSFTTLGCPDWPLDKIIANAAEYGFDAIDFRGLAGEMFIYKLPEFSTLVNETKSRIADAGLEVSCFSSSVKVYEAKNLQNHLEEIRAYAELCKLFGTPFIRVFGGGIGSTPREEAVRTAAAHFLEMAKIAEAFGVKLLLETHDDWTDCRDTRSLMEAVDSNAVGVLWDVHHPYRMIGEQPETTWETLGKWIAYTHVKDSLPIEPAPGAKHPFRYCLTGEGDIPLKRICGLLKQQGYEGYYTLEWEKKWHPEIAEADIAFPQYVSYMRKLAAELNS